MVDSRIARLICVASAILGGPAAITAQAPPPGSGSYVVTGPIRVIEADTLEVHIEGRRVGVAIAGIVVPQGNTACGRKGIAALQTLVAGGVELHEDLALRPFDRRLLRVYRVFDRAGHSLAEELTRTGFALPDESARAALDRLVILAAAAEASANAAGCVAAQQHSR